MAAPQLTVGRYQPAKAPTGGLGSGGFAYQPNMVVPQGGGGRPPSGPGNWYGGNFQHPAGGGGGAGVVPGTLPEITLPQGTPGQAAYTPDYSSLIGGSWEVAAAEAMMGSQMGAARAQFQRQLRQSMIDLGYEGDPTQLGNLSKYIDKETIQKAIDNKNSAYAQIKEQQAKANSYNAALLASRGADVSGTATETAADTVSQVEQARYEGLRNFLQGGETGLQGLANLKMQLAQGVMQARFAAAQRIAQMYPPTPAVPAQSPNWDDFWGSYQGGTWSLPGTGGWIVPAGNATPTSPSDPWYVGPGSGTAGDLSWLNPSMG